MLLRIPWLGVMLALSLGAAGQDNPPQPAAAEANADQRWAQLTEALAGRGGNELPQESNEATRLREEVRRLEYRNLGMRFWREFPEDKRRYEWLLRTVGRPPAYPAAFQPAPGEEPGDLKFTPAEWDRFYVIEGKPAFMAAGVVTDDQRQALVVREVDSVFRHTRQAMVHGGQPDWEALAESILTYSKQRAAKREVIQNLVSRLYLDFLARSKSAPEVESRLLSILTRGENPDLAHLVRGKMEIAAMFEKPAEFRFDTLDGESFSLAAARGRVVLVQMWSLGCESCFKEFPEISRLLKRYGPEGFEAVGLCLSMGVPEWSDADKVRQAVGSRGVDWPNALLAGEDDRRFRDKFSIHGVPVIWIFDRDGKLVAANVQPDQLERSVERIVHGGR